MNVRESSFAPEPYGRVTQAKTKTSTRRGGEGEGGGSPFNLPFLVRVDRRSGHITRKPSSIKFTWPRMLDRDRNPPPPVILDFAPLLVTSYDHHEQKLTSPTLANSGYLLALPPPNPTLHHLSSSQLGFPGHAVLHAGKLRPAFLCALIHSTSAAPLGLFSRLIRGPAIRRASV